MPHLRLVDARDPAAVLTDRWFVDGRLVAIPRKRGKRIHVLDRLAQEFDLGVDLTAVGAFHREVLAALARVPYGELTTYGALAERSGHPGAARAIGTAMNRNPIPIVLPCHRVVGANGKLVGYGGGLERKEQLLRLEGTLIV